MSQIEITSQFDPLTDQWDPYADFWTAVTIVVATYGYDYPEVSEIESMDMNGNITYHIIEDEPSPEFLKWEALANRAMKSTEGQGAAVLRIHGETLASARNEAAEAAQSNWIIFLDADDELSPDYVVNMLKAEGDIRKPATLGVVDGVEDDHPVMIEQRVPLTQGNHIVIGAMVRRDWFLAVGGFRELPALEDWDLWLRLYLEFDATVGESPDSIYRVHVQENSRNQNRSSHSDAYREIRLMAVEEYGVPYGVMNG